jgi:hypothetical protein
MWYTQSVTKTSLPESFREYFWDVDFNSLTLEKAPLMVLKRVLSRGNTDAILWMRKHYSDDQIKGLILTSRDIDQKTGTFWANVLGVDHKDVRCLQKPYSRIHFGLYS